MEPSEFGKRSQERFKSAVLATLSTKPYDLVLTVAQQSLPSAELNSKEKHISNRLRASSTGIIISFTAYFSDGESALQAAAQMTRDKLYNNIVSAGLPPPNIICAPTAFNEISTSQPSNIKDNDATSTLDVALAVGLSVAAAVLLVCCIACITIRKYLRHILLLHPFHRGSLNKMDQNGNAGSHSSSTWTPVSHAKMPATQEVQQQQKPVAHRPLLPTRFAGLQPFEVYNDVLFSGLHGQNYQSHNAQDLCVFVPQHQNVGEQNLEVDVPDLHFFTPQDSVPNQCVYKT